MSDRKRHFSKSEYDLMAEALKYNPTIRQHYDKEKTLKAKEFLEKLVAFFYSFDKERAKRLPKIENELKKRLPDLTHSYTMGSECLSVSEIAHLQQDANDWLPTVHVKSCLGCRTFAWLEWSRRFEETVV